MSTADYLDRLQAGLDGMTAAVQAIGELGCLPVPQSQTDVDALLAFRRQFWPTDESLPSAQAEKYIAAKLHAPIDVAATKAREHVAAFVRRIDSVLSEIAAREQFGLTVPRAKQYRPPGNNRQVSWQREETNA